MLAQDHQPQPVERGHGELGGPPAEQRGQALAHLLRGPAGEGEGQAGPGGDALLGHAGREAVGQRARLAGARPGDDHEWRPGRRGGPLLRVEPVQQGAARGVFRRTRPANGPIGRSVPRRLILRGRRGRGAVMGCSIPGPLILRGRRGRGGPRSRAGRLGPALPGQACLPSRPPGRGDGTRQGSGGGQVEQRGRAPVKFTRPEEPDHPVLAVVAGLLVRGAGPQPGDGLAEQAAAGPVQLAGRGVEQDGQFRAQRRDQPAHLGVDLLALGPGPEELAHHVRQRDQVHGTRGPVRPVARWPVGELGHPVQHPDRQRLAAAGAYSPAGGRLPGLQPDAALTVAVQVVTAALREEIDGAVQASPGAQGALDRKEIQFNVKRCRLTAEHRGRVRV